ncbi:DUF443 family protein [Enterococcus plantarum]|uniref:DUF443 family protein n=1 Tax=Enterococcus plantarum TaxID=1077675 RepID=UPI001A8FEAF0|nr:DUF443 family protein [Enterococcus plantarum]MBO0421632.1 DUF443 family protein [Enterococcus plantarum]
MIENTNNKRYRLFMKENKQYIIDSDTNIISIIIPWLIWLFPLNGYEIEDIQSLQIDKNKKEGRKGGLVLTSSVLSVVMIRIIPSKYILGKPFPDHKLFLTLLIMCFIASLFLFRMKVSKQRLYKGEVKSSIKVKLDFLKDFRPNVKSLIVYLAGLVIGSLFLIEMFKIFIVGGNPLVLGIFLMVYTFLIFANQTMQTPIKYEVKIMNLSNK